MLITLGGRAMECRFARRRRRTIGISIDAAGVAIAAPLRAPWRDIEAFVRHKERWILRKVDEWDRLPRPAVLRGVSGESLPLHGEPVTLEVSHARSRVEHRSGRLLVSAPSASRVLKVLVAWLKGEALRDLAPRTAGFSARLGIAAPALRLSSARRQWGVCGEDGTIRLNWRLVHLEPALADYVVAHEVAHLVELNHSKRFWGVLAGLYPEWREARKRLETADAALPILGVS